MKRIICWIFGHKYFQVEKDSRGYIYLGSIACLRCGYNPLGKQMLYFSGGMDLDNWDKPSYIQISKKDIRGNFNVKIKKNKIYKEENGKR